MALVLPNIESPAVPRPLGITSEIWVVGKLVGNAASGFAKLGAPEGVGAAVTEVSEFQAATVTANTALSSDGIRRTVKFGSYANIRHAYVHLWMLGGGAGPPDNLTGELYDVTHGAAIGSAITVSAVSATLVYEGISADAVATIPAADSVVTVKAFDATTNADQVTIYGAMLELIY